MLELGDAFGFVMLVPLGFDVFANLIIGFHYVTGIGQEIPILLEVFLNFCVLSSLAASFFHWRTGHKL